MRTRSWQTKSRPLLIACLALPVLVASSATLSGEETLQADQIAARLASNNQRRAALLAGYESCRHYSLDYTGFPATKSAEMLVEMTYTSPAEKRFRVVRQQGSGILINHVLKELMDSESNAWGNEERRARTEITTANYEFRLVGTDSLEGRRQYVLEVTPHVKSKLLYRGKIWVDATDFAVSRIVAEPAKNPSFWISHTTIEHEYKKVGDFYLPARNTSVSKARVGGTAKLYIEYLNYRIGAANEPSQPDVCGSALHETPVSEARESASK